MAFELKDGKGSAFPSKRRDISDYDGSIKVDGKLYWLNMKAIRDDAGKVTRIEVWTKPKVAATEPRPTATTTAEESPF